MNRPVLVISVALIALMVVLSVAVYPGLPPMIPAHVNSAGVDRWTTKTPGSWFLLPSIAVLIAASAYGAGAMMVLRPEWLNVPRKAQLLALPAGRRRHVLRWAWLMMQLVALTEVVTMSVTQWSLWSAATTHEPHARATVAIVVGCTVVLVAAVVLCVVRLVSEIGDEAVAA